MLIMNLRKNETIKIGDTKVTFLRKCGSRGFELGIKAPSSKSIHREEFFLVLKKERERFLKSHHQDQDKNKKP